MNRRRWTLWIAAISLAVSLALLDAYWRRHDAGSRTRDFVLSAMPPDASAVLFADLTELRRAPFATEFYNWIPKNQADAEYAQFLRDRKKIEAYASKSGTRETRGGREILTVPLSDSARKISFTFLSKEEVALTDAGDLAAFLAPLPNSTDAREWRERFTREAGSPVFAVIRQDAAAGSALASRTPGGFQSPQLSALLDQLQWITLAGKPQDNALRIVAEGECASDQTARQLADLLNGVLVLAQVGLSGPKTRQQLDPRIRNAYLELIKGADVSRFDRGETKSVRVVFDVTSKLLEAATIAVPAAPTPAVPTIPARKTPAAKAGAQKATKN